jgi:hypothetical protein
MQDGCLSHGTSCSEDTSPTPSATNIWARTGAWAAKRVSPLDEINDPVVNQSMIPSLCLEQFDFQRRHAIELKWR